MPAIARNPEPRRCHSYRHNLQDPYAKVTTAGMLAVTKGVCTEAVRRGSLVANPIAVAQETTQRALEKTEVRGLLALINRSTKIGQRDYALIVLLLRTGLRWSEAAGLTIGGLAVEQGHAIAIIRHGKGDERRIVTVATGVRRVIDEYLGATGRKNAAPDIPLFVAFDKGAKPTTHGLRAVAVNLVVRHWAKRTERAGLSAHGMRASFVIFARDGGAKIQQVPYFVGHKKPETPERYQKRKLNGEDTASRDVRL